MPSTPHAAWSPDDDAPPRAASRTPEADAPFGADLPRPTAVALLALVVLVSLGLRLWNHAYGLPHLFHSDYRQVEQAARLLNEGTFTHKVPYNPGDTYVHAAAAAVSWAIRRALGDGEPWEAFVERLRDPSVHHAIGRVTVSVLGSLLAIGVYLIARVRFPRRVAVLAAAIAAFAPMQVIFSHQTRIHVPAIVVLVFAAIAVVKIGAGRTNTRTAVAAGVGCAFAVAMVQYGFLLLGTAGLLTLILVRPPRAASRVLLAGALGFLLTHVVTMLAMYGTGLLLLPDGQSVFTDFWTLGMSSSSVALNPRNLALLVLSWIGSEPFRVLALLVFALACVRGRLAARDALVYGLYPVLALCVIGAGISFQPRYAMSATPFLAVLAAAGALSLRSALPRRALVGLLLAAPLATSVRYDMLLDSVDTRVAVDDLMRDAPEIPFAIGYEVVLLPYAPRDNVETIPPRGNYRVVRRGPGWGLPLLEWSRAEVFIRPEGSWGGERATDHNLREIGFEPYGVVLGGGDDDDPLPDAPQHPSLAIWTARRTGPTIEIWTRGEQARAHLEARLPPEDVATLGMR